MSELVTLHTWQRKDHDIRVDIYDRSKSTYNNQPIIQQAYDRLFDLVGYNELIWCTKERETSYACSIPPCVEWKIPIAPNKIIQYIDPMAWSRIIGIPARFPHEKLRSQWFTGAFHLASEKERKEYRLHIECNFNQPYDNMNPEELWGKLFSSACDPWADVIFPYQAPKDSTIIP